MVKSRTPKEKSRYQVYVRAFDNNWYAQPNLSYHNKKDAVVAYGFALEAVNIDVALCRVVTKISVLKIRKVAVKRAKKK